MIETGLRERKKERTRQELMRSALRLFADRGFDQVTVEEIAADCEVSPRTFFRYFSSKEDVLFAQSDRSLERLLETLRDEPADLRPLEALRRAMRTLAGDYVEDKEAVVLRHQIMTATPALRTRATERQHGWEAAVIEQLRAGGQAARMSDLDVRLVVAASMTALRVSIVVWVADTSDVELEHIIDTTFDRLHRGL
ncbi:MAG TPA: TetR family transcriptional regulator [Acidimicrobiales bacterium]|nr:TetR family transcriptional regulator [Acidimicrobiales bacterium]